jgi:hypothetical protein
MLETLDENIDQGGRGLGSSEADFRRRRTPPEKSIAQSGRVNGFIKQHQKGTIQ